MRSRTIKLAACLAFFAGTLPAAAQNVADFYSGKRLVLIVGSNPGGGYDAIGRLVARHLGRFVPGHPGIIVQNMPGGGSIALSNRVYRSEPQDGTVLGLVQRGVLLSAVTRPPNVQFDLRRFNWLGSVSPDTSLVVAWHTAPVKTVRDLFDTPLIVGGSGATSDLESSARLLNETIGTKFKIVSGYAGQADVLLAMERGEIQGTADWSWSEISTRHADYLAQKKISLILQNGVKRSPELPDIPLAMDFIKAETDRQAAALYFGLKQIARPVLCGPGVPPDRLEALQHAFAALEDDADYRAEAAKLGLSAPTPASEVADFVNRAAAVPPEVAHRLAAILIPHS